MWNQFTLPGIGTRSPYSQGCPANIPSSGQYSGTCGPFLRHQGRAEKDCHPRIRTRSLGLQSQWIIVFCRVAPFGAIFSAHWWGRLGGFLTRFLHLAIYVKHALWLYYVDDFLLCQRWDVLPLTATFIIILLQLFGIPISWKNVTFQRRLPGLVGNFTLHLVL